MTFKGKTDKGRYDKSNMTADHYKCLSLKTQLRNKLLKTLNEPLELLECFAGKEELFERVYKNFNIKKRVAIDIEPLKAHIIKHDANTYPLTHEINYNVIDLDHHKLEVLQTFKQYAKHSKRDCIFFLTFGIASFQRRSWVKSKTVYFNGNEEKTQLNYSQSYILPERYVRDCALSYGWNVQDFCAVRYKSMVKYYAFKLIKK